MVLIPFGNKYFNSKVGVNKYFISSNLLRSRLESTTEMKINNLIWPMAKIINSTQEEPKINISKQKIFQVPPSLKANGRPLI